ncbi:MAG: glycosyltransferase family 4 protein [Deltaproteobacteria bacterium]|nr:glycosyltransferase family 4 protein [Deltaproteobacteria bacterium]
MKFLMLNARYYPDIHGGGDKSIQFLAEGLVEDGHEVTVLATSKDGKFHEYNENGVKVVKIKLWNTYWFPPSKPQNIIKKLIWHFLDIYNPFMKKSVSSIIRREKPDIIHSHALDGFSTSAWDVAKKENIPVVHTLRGYKLLCPNATMFSNGKNCENQCFKCFIYSYRQKKVSEKVDGVIGISNYVLNSHIKLGFFRNSRTIRIFNAFKPVESPKRRGSRKKYNKIRFGYFGRIHPTKGIELILEVLNFLEEDTYELFLGGSGNGEYIEKLKSETLDKPVVFLGQISPESFFSKIDFLLAPSIWNEPLGRVVLESFNFGVPVIGSNRGGIPEMIDDSKNGFLFNPDNKTELINILRNINRMDNWENLQENAIKSSKRFLPSEIIRQHNQFYKLIIKNNKK